MPKVALSKREDFNKLSVKQKKVSVRILREKYGYSLPQIGALMGLTKSSAQRWATKDISDVDPETWAETETSITKYNSMMLNKLQSKIMGKMDHELETKSLPFGSLAFGLKVIGDLKNPRGQTNLNVSGDQVAVQVVRGDITYSAKNELKDEV